MYGYVYQQQRDEINYHGDTALFPTFISWNFPDRKVLPDFLTIIGH